MLAALLDALRPEHAKRIAAQAVPQAMDERTNELTYVFGYLLERILPLRNAREKTRKFLRKTEKAMNKDPRDVPCRYCGAAAKQPCINRARAECPPLEHFAAHEIRSRDARNTSTIDDPDELF